MEPRIRYTTVSPDAVKAMSGLEMYVRKCGLEKPLLELVRLRASQINGCAYCIDMHTKDARAAGETEQRLYGLNAWRETPYYSDRERAALEWTESVTLVSQTHIPDSAYDVVRSHFSEKEIVDLTMAIVSINAWNRLAIAMRAVPGGYKPPER
ncbi:MAG TPA: carboxymuconolactone decarboxylase family protein [Phycisphaerae bacterium]|nr:carboxymuconolactone decarboxylase family protein [Phycisphaerae bacterium]